MSKGRLACTLCGEREKLSMENGHLVCEVCATEIALDLSFEEARKIALVGVGRAKPLPTRAPMHNRSGKPERPGQARQGRFAGGGGDGLRRIGHNPDPDESEMLDGELHAFPQYGSGVVQPPVGEDSVTSIISDAEADAFDELDEEIHMDHGERADDRWRTVEPRPKAEMVDAAANPPWTLGFKRAKPRRRT
jgi:hypothetical protein